MDPVILATAATQFLAPFIKKAGGLAIDKLGEKLPESVGKAWDEIALRFKGNTAASGAAEELAKKPDDEDNLQAFEIQLKKALKNNEEFMTKLSELLESAKKEQGINNSGVMADHNSVAVGNNFQANNNSGTISFGTKSGNN